MPEYPPVTQTNPDEIIQGYPWPSSKLTRADMIRLTELRQRLGKPITELLHDAVVAYHHVLVNDMTTAADQTQDCGNLKNVPTMELIRERHR